MTIPHDFPSLIEGPGQAVLIAGAGLSAPNVPIVHGLKDRLDQVADDLGVPVDNDFYVLAEAILDKLASDGKTDSESRLWLAEKIGLLDDRRWFGELGLPLSGNTPRHRALARFVVEGRLHAVISLNWDALMEAALDSIGILERNAPPRPWRITRYARVVDDKHMPLLAHANVFPVIKPHGCVRELERARDKSRSGGIPVSVTFKLKSTELNELAPDQDNAINNNVKNFVAKCPLICVGWSASENYLKSAIVEIAQKVERSEPDSFTLVDLKWNSNHSEIAVAYNKDKSKSFAQVSLEDGSTVDCLMLWLQARYALRRMILMVPSSEREPLEKLLRELAQPNSSSSLQNWADYWLPTWIRLCWRAGAMKGVDPQTNRIIGPHEIPIVPRDAHVPLTGMSIERRDLHAAARLLSVISSSLDRFRFDLYPGGLLDISSNYLYLPLPGWKASVPSSDLGALKSLVEALKGLGYVKKLILVWLTNDDESPDAALRHQLEAQVARLMPLMAFAERSALSWIELDELNMEESP